MHIEIKSMSKEDFSKFKFPQWVLRKIADLSMDGAFEGRINYRNEFTVTWDFRK